MTALMYQPAGFRRAPLLRRRRGMGATASDFATIAASLTPGSADYQFFSGCAQNPTAPACQRDFTAQASQPVLTATQEATVRAAQAQGATPPTFQATAPISWIQSNAPPSTPNTRGNVAFDYSTGSGNTSTPAVGDSWTVSITGTIPHGSISVSGGLNGAQNDAYMGRADANGNWSKSGMFGSDQVGQWAEQWYANGVPVGTWNYTVTKPAATMQPAGFQAPNQQQQQQQTGSAPSSSSVSFLSTTILGIPLWIWGAGAIGAYFAFGQGGHYGR